jgi:putative chitinase
MAIPFNPIAEQVQRRLKALGHNLGTSGPAGDGVDGMAGDVTFTAMLSELPVTTPKPVPLKPATTPMSFAQAQIDIDLLCMAFPANTRTALQPWVLPTQQACVQWGIDTFREVASFLANINVESAGLTQLTESLNYSCAALIAKFSRERISVADANRYGRGNGHAADQEALANILYGGAWGAKNLGNTQPGDGWRFKGYGPKEITGRANQTAFANAIGKPLDEIPDYVRTPDGGMMSAGWYWKSHDLDKEAATPGVTDDRRAINGGTFGLADVEKIFDLLIEELLRREKAAA